MSSYFFYVNQLVEVVVSVGGFLVLFRRVASVVPKYFEILECVGVH